MVRAYFPQNSPGNINVNTNYPPQSDNQGGPTPPSGEKMLFNVTAEDMLFNNTAEEMEFNN